MNDNMHWLMQRALYQESNMTQARSNYDWVQMHWVVNFRQYDEVE